MSVRVSSVNVVAMAVAMIMVMVMLARLWSALVLVMWPASQSVRAEDGSPLELATAGGFAETRAPFTSSTGSVASLAPHLFYYLHTK